MYDYLAKIILLGPSGTGKSCLLHRFVKSEWRVLSSQTIGVEFATKIIKVGTGARRKRIKLQVSPFFLSLLIPLSLDTGLLVCFPIIEEWEKGVQPAYMSLTLPFPINSSGIQPAPSASAPSLAPTIAAPPAPSSSTTSPPPRPSTLCNPSSTMRARWPHRISPSSSPATSSILPTATTWSIRACPHRRQVATAPRRPSRLLRRHHINISKGPVGTAWEVCLARRVGAR